VIVHRFAVSHDPYRWDRLRLWSVALEVSRGHPWLGVGPGVFGHVTAPFDLARADWPVRFAKHVESTHSDYLRVLSETGILGAAAALGLILLIVFRARPALRRRDPVDAALLAALAGLFVHALFENLSARPRSPARARSWRACS
jgi:O-antigen ligase